MSPADPLSRTTLQLVDFAEQGDHEYVLFTPTRDGVPIAIDTWRVSDLTFTGYVAGDAAPVVLLPADTGWIVYSRKLVRRLTRAESIRQGLDATKGEYAIKKSFLEGLKAEDAEGVTEMAPETMIVGAPAEDERRGYL